MPTNRDNSLTTPRHFPKKAEIWSRCNPSTLGVDKLKLHSAIQFAHDNETPWRYDLNQEKAISKSESLYKLLEYIESHSDEASPIYIVSHNGTSFDFIFFRRLLSESINKRRFTKFKGTIIERLNYIDSLLLAKRFLTDRVSQPNLCKKYDIVNEAEHRALGDINALEKLYICLCNSFSKKINKDEDYLIHHPEEVNQYLFV